MRDRNPYSYRERPLTLNMRFCVYEKVAHIGDFKGTVQKQWRIEVNNTDFKAR